MFLVACRSHPQAPPEASVDAGAPSALTAPAVAWEDVAPGVRIRKSERDDADLRRTVWLVVRVDVAQARFEVRAPSRKRLETLAADPSVAFAANGGFFEADESASGLLVSRGSRLATIRSGGGSGVLVIADGRASIAPIDQGIDVARADVAMQCGPRLVELGGALGIRSDDGKRAARTAACVREGGRELDVVLAWRMDAPREGPSLFELAKWMIAPIAEGDASGCETALNLDGGPSTGFVARGSHPDMHEPAGPVPWALVVTKTP